MSVCLECGREIPEDEEVDLQLCRECMLKFDTGRLWEQHDNNELDALDFNESKSMREQYRIKGD